MKHLLELMTIGALLAVSCAKNGGNETMPQRLAVTEDMYSVTADAETGEVRYSFTADALQAFWTVTEPSGMTTSFNPAHPANANAPMVFVPEGITTFSTVSPAKASSSMFSSPAGRVSTFVYSAGSRYTTVYPLSAAHPAAKESR